MDNSVSQSGVANITYEEYEMAQSFAKQKLEEETAVPYEDLSTYELPPRTQFSMLKKPAVSIKGKEITFNTACIRLFEGIVHVLPFLSAEKRRLAVIMRKEEGSSTVEWAREKNGAYVNKTISSLEFSDKIYQMMGWNRNCRYKILGRIANSSEGIIIVFDLDEAVEYAASEEYMDKKTGEVKKRTIAYFPEKYRDCIGKTYSDYVASEQVSLFENIQDYDSTISQAYEQRMGERFGQQPFSDQAEKGRQLVTFVMEESNGSVRQENRDTGE